MFTHLTLFCSPYRSPDIEPGPRASMGGWGLGVSPGNDERLAEDDDEDEDLGSWDQAQEVVERMIGMNSKVTGGGEVHRDATSHLPGRRRREGE